MLKALDDQIKSKPENEADNKDEFTSDDIIRLDDRAIQYILRNVDSNVLAVALKTASLAIQGKFFKNMSRNSAIMLKEEIDYIGNVSDESAQEAQQKITDIIMALALQGEIVI